MMNKYYIPNCFFKGRKEKTKRFETSNHAFPLEKLNVRIISYLRICFFNSKKLLLEVQ